MQPSESTGSTIGVAPEGANGQALVAVSPPELVQLCALDPLLYGKTFFPNAFRQASPAFHADIFALLEDQTHRQVAIEVFRDGAKTTILRSYASRRIAYGVSRTILFVSEAQDHSIASLQWLKKAVEFNRRWSEVFGLVKGKIWKEEKIEIEHLVAGHTITCIALGITGQTRGINIDDYRPDLIIVDDPCDEENTGTPEQRKKTSDLFFGALLKSLAPRSESPQAKQVLLQTSLNGEDLINSCHSDPSWTTRRYGCFDARGKSRWEVRRPTAELVQDKQDHIARGQILLWLREMECTIAGAEAADFKLEWLRYWDEVPPCPIRIGATDPVPPPSDAEIARGLQGKDSEVHGVIGSLAGNVYLLDIQSNTGHQPDWSVNTFFSLVDRWRPLRWRVEGTGYQKALKWLFEQAMKARSRWVQVNAPADRRKKRFRILQAIAPLASTGRLYVHRSHHKFIGQFAAYPNVTHDDELDMLAMALDEVTEGRLFDEQELPDPAGAEEEKALEEWRAAP